MKRIWLLLPIVALTVMFAFVWVGLKAFASNSTGIVFEGNGSKTITMTVGITDSVQISFTVTGIVNARIAQDVPVEITSDCTVYVPDEKSEKYPNAIPFSEVSDWDFSKMLGASESDAWSQTICFGLSGSGVITQVSEIYISWFDVTPATATPINTQSCIPLIGADGQMHACWTLTPTSTVATATATPISSPVPSATPTTTPVVPIPTVPPVTHTQSISIFMPLISYQIDPLSDIDFEFSLLGDLGGKSITTGQGKDQKSTGFIVGDGYALRISVGGYLWIYNADKKLVNCEVYVPDVLSSQYPTAVKFSLIKDWSYETMLGASSADSVPQTICRKPVSYLVSDQTEFYFAWRKQ